MGFLGVLMGIWSMGWDINVAKKMQFLPPMTGNGLYKPPMKMLICGMVYYCFTHIITNLS